MSSLGGKPCLGQGIGDAAVEGIEGAAEWDDLGGVSGDDCGEAGTEQAVVGSSEEEGGAPAKVCDAISMAVRQAARSCHAGAGNGADR